MKKFFSIALVAMVAVAMISFVSCKKNEPEQVWETPETLTGTEWADDGGETWLAVIYFETATTGRKTVHNVINGEAYDTESDFTYTYQNGSGEYIDDVMHTYRFTIDGGTLKAREDGFDYDETYKRRK